MTNEDAIKWLENLKQDIGQLRHEDLWPYAQAIDEIMKLLEEQKAVVRCKDCKYWSAERINDFNKCRRWINVGVKNFATMGDWYYFVAVIKDDSATFTLLLLQQFKGKVLPDF